MCKSKLYRYSQTSRQPLRRGADEHDRSACLHKIDCTSRCGNHQADVQSEGRFEWSGVNVLSPAATATELAKAALGEEGRKVYAAMTPLQRTADPEIGAVAALLASSDSSFMTAGEVAVDGGLAQP